MSNYSLSLSIVVTIFNNPKIKINSAHLPSSRDHQFQVEENMKREIQKKNEKLDYQKYEVEGQKMLSLRTSKASIL